MNLRIKELAIEARLITVDGITRYALDHEFEKRFAELIVRECAEIAKHNVMNISTYADAEFVDQQIMKHFGVKL